MTTPGAPFTYFTDGRGGGGGDEGFVGFEILAKRDFFWVHERRVAKKKTGTFWGIVLFISQNQQ